MGPWRPVVLFGLGLVFAACGGGDDSKGSKAADGITEADKTAGGGTPVAITNFVYEPKELTVPPGTKVTWVNNDSAPHNVQDLSELKIPISRDLTRTRRFRSPTKSRAPTRTTAACTRS
jgi:plastocyanin